MKALRPIMIAGTGSDVGKSIINTAFCRIFLQDGYNPAPFKAQNMSLNSFATPDGLEIGRAQAVQAEACGIPCCSEMNPVLLKPNGDMVSQVVLHGKPAGNKTASEYFNDTNRDNLFGEVMQSFHRLQKKHNPIVIEGAGSISEMNLWDKDITNMRVAQAVNAPTFLVADIDRGGVFASVYGSIKLLPVNQQNLIKGIIINKFRGDENLFIQGKRILEEISGKPVVGIIPWFRDIFVEQEDSVSLDKAKSLPVSGKINIAIIRLKHLSNFTDFNILSSIDETNVYYTDKPENLNQADIIIIPGSKNTINDMLHLQQSGLAETITRLHKNGKSVYGICGGYQIMGSEINDPLHVEGVIDSIPGLGILPVITTLSSEKKTEQCSFTFPGSKEICSGYEIHMGKTESPAPHPLCLINSERTDGFFLNSKTWGTYIHGIFDNSSVIECILRDIYPEIKISVSYHDMKEQGYNQLADLIRRHIDIEYIYKTLRND